MRAWIWLRALALLLVLFTAGHTVGVMSSATRGAQQATVLDAMRGVHFPVMGFMRSYWDFYHGFGLTISLLLAVLAVLAWQLSTISRRAPRAALPMTITLMLAFGGLTVLSGRYFFSGPIVLSFGAFLLAGTAVVLLARESAAV